MDKFEFLKESISDVQATIRALDVKAGFFIAFLCFPLASLKDLNGMIVGLSCKMLLFLILIVLTWSVSLYFFIKSIFPQENPSDAINFYSVIEKPKGFFYGGYLVTKLSYCNLFKLSPNLKMEQKFTDELKLINDYNENNIISELLFERMKLIIIRDLKIFRIKFGLYSFVLFIILDLIFLLLKGV